MTTNTTALATVRHTPNDLSTERLGEVLVKSGFFSDTKDQAQAIVKVLYGRELGIGPMTSMLSVHVIQGKPAPSAGLLAALIKRSGRYTYRVRTLDNEGCELEFFERDTDGKWESLGPSVFTLTDARTAGALNGRNAHTWKAYGRNMLFARALSNGARWFCADIFGGPVYTPEELGAAVDEEGNVRDNPHNANTVTGEILEELPAKPAPPTPPARTRQQMIDRWGVLWNVSRDLGCQPAKAPDFNKDSDEKLGRWLDTLEAKVAEEMAARADEQPDERTGLFDEDEDDAAF